MTPELAEYFETGAGKQSMQTLQLITFAMIMGVTIFVALPVVLIQPGQDVTQESLSAIEEQVRLLSAINIALCFGAIVASTIVPGKVERKGSGSTVTSDTSPIRAILSGIVLGHIVRIALLEAPAFLGIVTVSLAKKGGLLVESPVYWINLASTLPFYFLVAVNWPTRSLIADKVAAIEAHSLLE